MNYEDAKTLLAACYDRSTELAEWAVRWLDGYDGAEAHHDNYEGWCLILEPDVWYATDGTCEISCGHDAKSACREYVDEGDWGESDTTAWVSVCGYRKAIDYRGKEVRLDDEHHDIEVEPTEPDCVDEDGHDWQSPYELVGGLRENPGVWGRGGGVVIQEACVKCGCGRITDTWAQNPSNGVQGLTSITYRENLFTDELNSLAD